MYYKRLLRLDNDSYLYLINLLEYYRDLTIDKIKALKSHFPNYSNIRSYKLLRWEYYYLVNLISVFNELKYCKEV